MLCLCWSTFKIELDKRMNNQEKISDKLAQIHAKSILINAEKDNDKRQELVKQKKKLELQLQIDRIRQMIKNLG